MSIRARSRYQNRGGCGSNTSRRRRTLIVSDGRTVAIQNTKLKTVDRYPLTDTPLDLVLGDNVDLANDKSVVGVVHDGDSLVVKARSHSSRAQGNIAMVFAERGLSFASGP